MTEKSFKCYYSLVTGRVERILSDEINLLEVYQIPLFKNPKNSCNKCYTKRYIKYDEFNKVYLPCSCVKKVIDSENHKNAEISFYSPK
jgi:hypothetical protein